MTGLPRSGTTYLSAVLHRPPSVVTISDPGGVWKKFQRKHGTSPRILERIEQFRAEILGGEEIPVLDGTEGFEGRGRVDTCLRGAVSRRRRYFPVHEVEWASPVLTSLGHLVHGEAGRVALGPAKSEKLEQLFVSVTFSGLESRGDSSPIRWGTSFPLPCVVGASSRCFVPRTTSSKHVWTICRV